MSSSAPQLFLKCMMRRKTVICFSLPVITEKKKKGKHLGQKFRSETLGRSMPSDKLVDIFVAQANADFLCSACSLLCLWI